MRVVLIGGGGHASDVLGAFEDHYNSVGPHPVVGFVDDDDDAGRRLTGRGVPRLGNVDDLVEVDATHFLLASGWPATRQALLERIPERMTATTIVHPLAALGVHVPVGRGTVILGGAHLSPLARVGDHVYLSHGALIGHDCQVGDFVSVMPGAAVSGDTVLEPCCTIGTHATVIEGVTIGAGAILGAGAVAVRDVPPGVTAVGVPAAW